MPPLMAAKLVLLFFGTSRGLKPFSFEKPRRFDGAFFVLCVHLFAAGFWNSAQGCFKLGQGVTKGA